MHSYKDNVILYMLFLCEILFLSCPHLYRLPLSLSSLLSSPPIIHLNNPDTLFLHAHVEIHIHTHAYTCVYTTHLPLHHCFQWLPKSPWCEWTLNTAASTLLGMRD